MNLVYQHPRTGGQLWQAGARDANFAPGLNELKVKAVVYAAAENQPSMPEHFDVIRARLLDDPYMDPKTAARTAACADEVSSMIARYLCRGQNVVSSCWAGLNRSGLCSALTLVRFGMSPDEAVSRVRAARSERALGNPVFVGIVKSARRKS